MQEYCVFFGEVMGFSEYLYFFAAEEAGVDIKAVLVIFRVAAQHIEGYDRPFEQTEFRFILLGNVCEEPVNHRTVKEGAAVICPFKHKGFQQ